MTYQLTAGDRQPDYQWAAAYRFAVANSVVFVALSGLFSVAGVREPLLNIIPDIVYCVGAIAVFQRIARAGGALTAVNFFVLGSAVFFGFGTAYATILHDRAYLLFFSPEHQREVLPKINLLNSISILIVMLTAWIPAQKTSNQGGPDITVKSAIDALTPLRVPLILLAVPTSILLVLNFPQAENLLLRNLLGNLTILADLAILLSFASWSKLSVVEQMLAMIMTAALLAYGLLQLSKTAVVIPLFFLVAGLWFDRPSRKYAVVVLALVSAAYIFVLADVCNDGRNHPRYLGDLNTVADRVAIVDDTLNMSANDRRPGDTQNGAFRRVAAAPIQAFLIDQYDSGARGRTIVQPWAALIPRFLWPDKPIITRVGTDFDGFVFRRRNSGSALAPTYSAEAYWNGGWLGVLAVSILLGLEVGWFTRKWHALGRDGLAHIGILVFAVPVIRTVAWVETWTIATYVGGFATLFVLIKLADWVVPFVVRELGGSLESQPVVGGIE